MTATETSHVIDKRKAEEVFAKALGLAEVSSVLESVGGQTFLKFVVGRRAPIYDRALRETNARVPDDNLFKGLLGLTIRPTDSFPGSVEANTLKAILTRSTRKLESPHGSLLEHYVPFQHNEENSAIQPADHVIVGRRGVGKSTLVLRAVELLRKGGELAIVLDMEQYKRLSGLSLVSNVLSDICRAVADKVSEREGDLDAAPMSALAEALDGQTVVMGEIAPRFKRGLQKITKAGAFSAYLFLDDFHYIQTAEQPRLLDVIHGSLKGAGGWLKVVGIHTLLRVYDPAKKVGLQMPGDAQSIPLDLTLADPKAAEEHLRAILLRFLQLVGIDHLRHAMAEKAFHRLVWANAGVPRDFLQMFASSIDHAARSRRRRVELTDANVAIGELGQQKMGDVEGDAENRKKELMDALRAIERHCLDGDKINAFLIRSEDSEDLRKVQSLADLRLLHILHRTITPHKAGERYDAYMLDYSLFTGFRRRPGIKEMLPSDGQQFKAAELRKIPILPKGFVNENAA